MMKKVLALALCVCMAAMLLAGCGGAGSSSAAASASGKLTMATEATFQPYEYYENGTIVGIDVDVATAICDTLGMTLK